MDTYEKKYKEAQKWIEGIYPNLSHEQQMEAEAFFPELKESEDERIRKMCMRYLDREYQHCPFADDKKNIEKCIAWLEKQGEQKPTLRERYKNIAESEWFKKTHEGMSVSDDEKVDNVNKIEPKFKVGDWVINRTNATIMQIINNKDFYESVEIGGQRRIDYYNYLEWDFRLWTIQDAKDGDVLVASDKSLFIYDGSINENFSVGFHIAFTECMDIILNSDDGCGWEEKDSCHPATKEQRDTMMKAMADAGYTFDFEKKELKKIEQKPAWSEEDDILLNDTIYTIKEGERFENELKHENCHDSHTYQVIISWLKSLKDRVQPKQEWSEEDEKAINDIMWIIEAYRENGFNETHIQMADNSEKWLKSLRPQNTWKPSGFHLECISDAIAMYQERGINAIGLKEILEELKKLKEE